MKTISTSLLISCWLLFGATKNAHAYIDPGTGSYMLQLLAAAVLGAMFTVKMYWAKIKVSLSRLIPKKSTVDDHDPGN